MENRIKFVKTQRLAGWLMFKGFHFLRTDTDRNCPSKLIYIFDYKEGFDEEIDNYTKLYGRKN